MWKAIEKADKEGLSQLSVRYYNHPAVKQFVQANRYGKARKGPKSGPSPLWKGITDVVTDPVNILDTGLSVVEKNKRFSASARKLAEKLGKRTPVISLGLGGYDGYKQINPADTVGQKYAKVLIGAGKEVDNAVIGGIAGLSASAAATPVVGVAAGIAANEGYKAIGANDFVDRQIEKLQQPLANGIDGFINFHQGLLSSDFVRNYLR